MYKHICIYTCDYTHKPLPRGSGFIPYQGEKPKTGKVVLDPLAFSCQA